MKKSKLLLSFGLLFVLMSFSCANPKLQKRMYNDIQMLKTDVERIDAETKTLSERFKNHEDLINKLLARVDELEGRMNLFENKLKELEEIKKAPPVSFPQKISSPEEMYKNAMELLRAGEYIQAAEIFREFVKNFPDSPLADNAQYWLGECFYAQREYKKALEEFQKVLKFYPNGNKVPDAMLKIGLSYISLKDLSSAREIFKNLIEEFPNSHPAEIAKERLSEISK